MFDPFNTLSVNHKILRTVSKIHFVSKVCGSSLQNKNFNFDLNGEGVPLDTIKRFCYR